MSIWKDSTSPRPNPAPAPETREPARFDAPPKPGFASSPATAPSKPELAPSPASVPSKPELKPSPASPPVARGDTSAPRKESLIAVDITIEGKIEGGGSVRIAGKFKGDASVQGDLTIEAGAKLTGAVRADKVTIAGELEGNVEEASHVDLLQTGVVIGDLKASTLTVASGARMRGQAEFGWDEGKGSKIGKRGNGHGTESGTGS